MVCLRSGFQTDPRERHAQIFVKMIEGGTRTIFVPLSTTGHGVKMLLMQEYGMGGWRCDRLRLIYAGLAIEDNDMLYDRGVRKERTIHLVGRFGSDRFCEICRVPTPPPKPCPGCVAHGSAPN